MADYSDLEQENLRLQKAMLELDNENRRLVAAIREHHDKMTALGSAGGEQDRKLWNAIILTTRLAHNECQEAGE